MASSFSLVEKNSEQMLKFECEVAKGMNATLRILDDLMLTSDGSGEISEFADRKVKELKNVLEQFIKMDEESKTYIQAVEQVRNEVGRNRDTPLKLDPCLQKALQQTRHVTTNYERHPKYREFMEQVNELTHPEAATATPNTNAATDDDDSELQMTEETVNTIDPITRQEIVTAVRNKKCRHLYDYNTMMAHIQQRKGKARCPIPGCVNTTVVTAEDLVADRELQNHINKKRKRN